MSNLGDIVNSKTRNLRTRRYQNQQRRRRLIQKLQGDYTHMQELSESQLEPGLFPTDQPSKDGLLNHLKVESKEPMLESHGETLTLTESESLAQSPKQKLQSELFSHEDLEEDLPQPDTSGVLLKS